ncbi:MAG TPA: hypothetical protein VF807_05155, partial [Ktedonobacterales bacterium]
AEIASATERTFHDMPIYTIGVHDPSPHAPAVQRQLDQIAGLRGRNISMTAAERHKLKADHPEWMPHDLHEAEIAELHHQLIRTSQHTDKVIDTVVWVAESEYVQPYHELVGRAMRVFNSADLVVVCIVEGDHAKPELLDALATLGNPEKVALRDAGSTTILVDSAAARTMLQPLAEGMASFLFSPVQNATNPIFRRIIARFRAEDAHFTAMAVRSSLLPVDLAGRSWWDRLTGRVKVNTEAIEKHLIEETNSVLMGQAGPSYGTPQRIPAGAQALAMSYLIPLRPHALTFETVAHHLTDWLERTYHLPPPSFVAAPQHDSLVTDPVTGQAGVPCQVTVLYRVSAASESATPSWPAPARDVTLGQERY